ncbi:Alternative dihydrofolate reductase 3 [Enhygromyxa salina]|uniref:Alternative dihydrofolate reductase 3 n=1 Tax=Enhygromyxa salina TaxID=215803 RepID=A0A0C2CTJ6_9BACT|nr:nuclear transport factor 2 family protein [Enhygromyxa salina]KIG14486.1 Alternative dihydrofolate reductase 3 [Enhygromyxa salina]
MSDAPRPALEELTRANREFYRAFAAGDIVGMDRLWADHQEVLCMHPGWTLLRGRERVMASWRGILRRPTPVRFRDEVIELLGEVGVVACVEVLPEAELAATNVFVLEQGRWRMLHHHAGLIARSLEREEDEPDEPDQGRLLN